MLPGYWSGRISSLNDRYHNEAINVDLPALHPMMDDNRRMCQAFGDLAKFCKTPEAKKSMDEYAFAYWNKHGRQAPAPIGSMVFGPRPVAAAMSQEKKAGDGEALTKKEKKGGMLGRLGLRRKSGV